MATLTKEQRVVVLKAETLAETQDLSASWKHVICMGLKPLHYLRVDPGRPRLTQVGPGRPSQGEKKKNWRENHIQWIPYIKYDAFFSLIYMSLLYSPHD